MDGMTSSFVHTAKSCPGILIELKAGKECTDEQLQALSETALEQIKDRSYEAYMTAVGINKILKYGVAFCGKDVRIATE